MTATTTPVVRATRAVLRDVQAGSMVSCKHCTATITFRAKMRPKQVICNLYRDGAWVGIEHYHAECYDIAGEPHGIPADMPQRIAPSR